MNHRVLTTLVLLALAACMSAPPGIDGVAGAPPQPASYWTPPRSLAAPSDTAAADGVLSPEAAQHLTLPQAVDLALTNNPATRISWAQARAAADAYGVARGSLYPTISAGESVTRSKTLTTSTLVAGERTQYGPSVNLSYLVFDLGGRSGAIDVARQTAIAADLSHNATVQNTILAVEGAIYTYLGTRALRDADSAAVGEATANLAAAEARHNVGLATIGDVLQARTARSQAVLNLESLEGQLHVARGALAVTMGLPANMPFEVPDVPAPDSLNVVTASVDSLIALAVRRRPDLAQAQAEAQAAAAQIRATRGAALPSIAFTGAGGYTNSEYRQFPGPDLLTESRDLDPGVCWIQPYLWHTVGSGTVDGRQRPHRTDAGADRIAGVHVLLRIAHGRRSGAHVRRPAGQRAGIRAGRPRQLHRRGR